jgi:hypothetical protein
MASDPLIQILNKRISSNIADNTQPATAKPTQNFSEVLDSKRNEKLFEKLSEQMGGSKNEVKVTNASDIQINRLNTDVENQTNFDPKQKVMDIFASLNDNMTSMDDMIEVLSDPNIKLSRDQLLACQLFSTKASSFAELSSKLLQSVSSTITSLVNTNVG